MSSAQQLRCWLLSMMALASAPTVSADVCQVPSAAYATVQAAVDAPSCTAIDLADQTFAESVTIPRDLALRGISSATTVIEGRVEVRGAATRVVVEDLKVDGSALSVAGCFAEALVVEDGAQLDANRFTVVNSDGEGCLLFADGFESANTSAWSTTSP